MSSDASTVSGVDDALDRLSPWPASIVVGLAIGFYGVARLLVQGTTVLGITDQVPWGILISTYEFFLLTSVGVVVGVVALSLVFGVERFDVLLERSLLLALATLVAGLTTILVSLGQPLRSIVYAIVGANPSSPIWWVVALAGPFGAVLLALLALHAVEGAATRQRTLALGVVAVLLGVGLAVAAGMIFGTAEARSYYGGPIAPVYFLLTALLSGVAAVALVAGVEARRGDGDRRDQVASLLVEDLRPMLGLLVAATLLVAFVKAVYGLTATSDSTAMAYEQLLFGSFGPVYWLLGVVLGMLVPLVLLGAPQTRTTDGVLAASALALLGLFVTRYEFVVGGQVVALTAQSGNEYPIASYAPSGTELAVVVFAFALCALVYTLGVRALDHWTLPGGSTVPEAPGTTAESRGGDDD